MNLIITGHGLTVTPSINEYVHQKLERVLRHFDHVVDIKITLDVNKSAAKDERQTAQCAVHVKGNDLFAKVARHDMYLAIDALMDRMDEQLSRFKEKKRGRSVSRGIPDSAIGQDMDSTLEENFAGNFEINMSGAGQVVGSVAQQAS